MPLAGQGREGIKIKWMQPAFLSNSYLFAWGSHHSPCTIMTLATTASKFKTHPLSKEELKKCRNMLPKVKHIMSRILSRSTRTFKNFRLFEILARSHLQGGLSQVATRLYIVLHVYVVSLCGVLHKQPSIVLSNTVKMDMRQKKKKNVLFPQNPTNRTFLGPTLNIFGTSENFSSIFRVFWMIFMHFPYKKTPKKYRDVCGNNTFIFSWPNMAKPFIRSKVSPLLKTVHINIDSL